jgi:hypothetical protein
LANAKNGKDCAQRAFDAKSRMMVRIDLTLRIYHILGGIVWGVGAFLLDFGIFLMMVFAHRWTEFTASNFYSQSDR